MTLRTTQRGLVSLILGIVFGLPLAGAQVQQEPPKAPEKKSEPKSKPTTQPVKTPDSEKSQVALEKLNRMREEMQREDEQNKPPGEAKPPASVPRQPPARGSAGASPSPPTTQPIPSEKKPQTLPIRPAEKPQPTPIRPGEKPKTRPSLDELKQQAGASTQRAGSRRPQPPRPEPQPGDVPDDFVGPPQRL
ncbi:MAG: hypothetical protein KAY37_16270, partial [Phycisphaerae bacterium]|nr:hypothetical protein [Phycisphaerae bacterium]